ncbi:beta-galactosidase [Fontibacillus panacisegetis]|uniref:Beta-galactosidase n=1 Tax=Fontibacillus panacisegetis TaxID=670482 RepID=A0A1G7SBJ6_9BACL|nr:glycoside hydrolase family 2 TIM barrel-domain containing protein [Fontibacillus panacisegetis]SDG20435.1 beta-galactosidase [Fontibacillus panacisegetis]
MKSFANRIETLINDSWKFSYGDCIEGKDKDFDDTAWYDIGIPHSFGTPYFMENEFYVGYGSYRKELQIDREWIGKTILLEFQAAFQEAEIYLNGQFAGSHKGGYTAFVIDISTLALEGTNLLFVRLNNLWNPRLAPRAGEHVFNGGLYRDVSLIITDPLHIEWYGTHVTTPEVSADRAVLNIETEVVNANLHPVKCKLVSRIEYEGVTVFETVAESDVLQPGQSLIFKQTGIVDQPNLWHPDTPHLYTLTSQLYENGLLKDDYTTTFGIRWFYFDAKKGFFLNGSHYDILGANVHQDHAGWGDAVTRAGMRRDVKLIKDCGMNFIRGSHYPHHPYFAAECDKQGILFWSELCFWGVGGANVEGYWTASAYPIHEEDKAEFKESCLMTLREMIRTNRNHPSIIVWSMCNEPFFSNEEVMEDARALIVRLVEESHRLDPARPAAVGGAQREGVDALGDLAGYNGDGASLYIDPGFPSFVSEYGSTIDWRPGEYTPSYTDRVERNPQWRSGKALWCGFHHGSFVFDMGSMGMIDYHRLPLGSWYWYRNELLGIAPPPEIREGVPYALRLTADKYVMGTDGTDDAHLIVELLDEQGNRISNTIEVTLEIVQGGAIFPTGRTLVLSPENGSFLDGAGAIEVRSYYAGNNQIVARAEGVQFASIDLMTEGEQAWSGQMIHIQTGPPDVQKIPSSGESTNIAKSRPVFCSSYALEHPAMNVADGREDTCWEANDSDSGQWVMVDLEGRKNAEGAVIAFAESSQDDVEVSYSYDGKLFKRLFFGNLSDKPSIEVDLSGGLRYLKVYFPQNPVAVKHIEIFD